MVNLSVQIVTAKKVASRESTKYVPSVPMHEGMSGQINVVGLLICLVKVLIFCFDLITDGYLTQDFENFKDILQLIVKVLTHTYNIHNKMVARSIGSY